MSNRVYAPRVPFSVDRHAPRRGRLRPPLTLVLAGLTLACADATTGGVADAGVRDPDAGPLFQTITLNGVGSPEPNVFDVWGTGTDQVFLVGERGGMRKRVGLARAIVLEPRIVLYDEPTTGLDPITTNYVDEMILRAKETLGVTSVVISHDIGSAFNVADYIAFLYEGAIVAYGPPATVRASEHEFVAKFLSTWFKKN